MLAPLLEVDLTRDWQEHLLATDASDSFGFGACVADCTQSFARDVGRLAAKRDMFVRLDRDEWEKRYEPERPRQGGPC